MADFTVPTRESLFSKWISDYAASQPDKSVARGSIPYLLGRVVSGLAWSLVARLLNFDKQRLPDTATGANLDRHGNIYQFKRKGAAGSSGVSAFRATGTVGAAVTTGSILTHSDGTEYQITTVGAVIGGGGSVDVDIAAVSKGLATNKVTGETLTFQSPPVDVNATGVLVVDLTKGADTEDYEDYRPRLLAHIGDPPTGGAIHDYVERGLELAGVANTYVYKNRRGQGTLDIAVLGAGSGEERIITDLATIQDWFDAIDWRPANVRDVKVIGCTATEVDVDVQISVDDLEFSWDWDDEGTSYAVTAFDDGLMTLTVPSMPDAVVAGVRLITNTGEEAKVISRSGDDLTIALTSENAWFTDDPTLIYASGDLVVPVQDAIKALFDRLGPARSYPATTWEADLGIDSIITASRNVFGCTKAQVNDPAADQIPADTLPPPDTVPFLVPGSIIVRKLA